MFPFSSSSKKTDAAPASPVIPPAAHPLDALTGGAFSASTSGERSARIREWLTTQPAVDKLQEVFKEMSARDKGAARAVRERLDEIRRASTQQAIAAEWAEKAENLLALSKLNIADALAWQRDAAKAGAPLSREPLAALKSQLAARIKTIEDLQHRVQVQREVAVLLAQRIEVLSTKPWRDAQAALEGLGVDVQRWRDQAQEIMNDATWPSVEARFPSQLEAAQTQLQVVWEAFQSALAQTVAAAEDAQLPLPPVPVWADELRTARGLSSEAAAPPVKPKIDSHQQELAMQAVKKALATLEQETAEGHGKASMGAAAALRNVLKTHGQWIDNALEARVHAALVAAGELQGWQRWSADQIREDLLARAEALLPRPEGQAIGGRKMQETLRHLREQWKQTDQSAPTNHGLWKRFDDTCNAAYKAVVTPWLDKMRSETAEHKAQRQALIDEVNVWVQTQATEATDNPDWKAIQRQLFQFSDRWRASGHVGEKLFAELQPLWKQAMQAASAPLEAAQKASVVRRHALIEEATALGAEAQLRVDAIRALQQRWQTEAQTVPIERKHEQRLWDAFRRPIDEAFQRKTAQRQSAAAELNARDRTVLNAAKVLEAANASGDVNRIREAMTALDAALRGTTAPAAAAQAPGDSSVVASTPVSDDSPAALASAEAHAPDAEAAPQPAQRRVVAVRGDDRPGMKKDATPAGRTAPRGERRDARFPAGERIERGERGGERHTTRLPRLGDVAFRAQRDALEQAQATLRKLTAQAHGEMLTQLLAAWQQRDAQQLPSAQALGRAVTASVRNAWAEALAAPVTTHAADDAGQALLRLEMAAEVPTPAEYLDARRALQLHLLTRRGDPTPAQTWAHDTARVLASASDEASAKRLQSALKALLRRSQRS